jgi:pyroglutamyl-peptidase
MLVSSESHVQQTEQRRVTVLLTGFGPFANVERNPSELIVAELGGTRIAGHEVVGRILPVSAETTPAAVRSALEETEPALAVLLGVAPGRAALAAERVAINVFDFPEPDNDGALPVDVPIELDGPAAYFATLPLRAIVDAWHRAGIPGYLSDTAGTYLCNAALYTALHATAEEALPVGLLHLPSLPAEVAGRSPPEPSMLLEAQIEGTRVALEATVAALVA